MYEAVERLLPKPSSVDYASARLLEALVEAKLALDFLKRGLTRNAAGKAFQAWKAVLAALLKLERLKAVAKTEEEKKWLEERAVPRVPTTKMIALSQMLRELGYRDVSAWTNLALNLQDYQYHGPDPDMALSKYRTREEAARAVVELVSAVVDYVQRLREKVQFSEEVEKALESVRAELAVL